MFIKAVRLFVSSTFADFAAERDVLQREVFPALDIYCAARGYQFYPLDLRWGVNEEAQLDQRTIEICLGEVRAAKQDYPPPNFLIMIGNRYGFVPLPYAIAQDEFEAIAGWLESRERQDAARSLRSVYQHDDNHLIERGLVGDGADGGPLIGAYTLRSRADELPDLRPVEAWAEREAELRSILQETADGLFRLGRVNAAAREKYFLSLTDQEIIHGLPGYQAGVDRASPPSPDAEGPPAIAFIREIVSESAAMPGAIGHYFEQQPRLDVLKDGIRRALHADHVVTATAVVDQNGRFSEAYLADFAAQIQRKLKSAIDQHIASVEAIERSPDYALESERAAHQAFAERKLEIFVGREDTLGTIAHYLASTGDRLMILHGRSGLGKSALMARAIAAAETGGVPVIARFVGASAASSNLRSLLVSIIEDLVAHGIISKPGEFEQDANKFNTQIEKLLMSVTNPAIVFLDALDQLQKPHDLGWLPAKLPEALKLVVSVLDDPAYEADSGLHRDLRNRVAPEAFLEVGSLGLAQGREILSALEQQTRHRLQDRQRTYIIDKFEEAGCSPLYLRTAFESSRSWKSYQRVGAGRYVLAEDTDGIIAQFIGELSSVQHHEAELVTRTLGYLAATKDGLSAKELTDVLSRDPGVMRAISSERHAAQTDKLPPSVWVRLSRDLSPFLVEKQFDDQPLLQFFHRQVAEVARAQHYGRRKTELHAALAAYFESQASEQQHGAVYGKRSLSELPYQLDRSENTSRLGEILMSPDWMQQKLAAFGVRPLIDDYQYARTRAQRLAGQTLDLAAGPLARDNRQLAAQIIGRLGAAVLDNPAEAAAIDGLFKKARALIAPPAIVPGWPNFTAPGGPEIRRFEGHTKPVNAVAFSPDGRHIVSGSDDKTLRLWEAASGQSRSFEGHNDSVEAVAFSPDGRHIVSGSNDKTLRLWEVASGLEIGCLGGHTDRVKAVVFSPDGRHILSGSWDKTLRLWEATNRREVTRLEGHNDSVEAVAFSPDGRGIVSGSRDKTLRLWEVASGRSRRIEGHTNCVIAVVFTPDGRHIVSGSWDNTLRLWEVASGREIPRFKDPTSSVSAVAISPDGRHIVSGSWKTLRLWEVASGREINCLEDHSNRVNAVVFSPDGRHVLSGSSERMLRLWEVMSGESRRLARHADRVQVVAFSPDGRHIASAAREPRLRLWEVASGQSRRFEHTGLVEAVAFSPDGRHIVSGSADNRLRLWEVASGQETNCFEGHTDVVNTVAFSPNGRHIVSGSNDKTLRLWEVASGREIDCFKGHAHWVRTVAVSRDGRHIVSGSSDTTLRLWEAASGQSRRFVGHTDSVEVVAFSPDGRQIVSGSNDKTLRLWEAASGQSRPFEARNNWVKAVAFSPDGRHIVSGSDDNRLQLWELASGQSRRFSGHTGWVMAVAFSSDGRHIVSGSGDNTLRLWEMASGREIARLDGDSSFECFALAPNRNGLVVGDAGGRVHLLDILVDETDKTIWLGGPASRGGMTKPSHSVLRRLLVALGGRLSRIAASG